MHKSIIKILLIFVVLVGFSCAPRTGGVQTPSEIKHVENFALLDSSGKFQELYYYSDMKAVVLISQENGCPIIQKSFPYLEELKKKYGPLGVVFLMINANPQDDRVSINQEIKDYGIDIPVLEDKSGVITESLGIKRTAEAILINPRDWSIAYQGAISDQFGYETQKITSINNYLEDGIKAVLANKPVLVSHVPVQGCLFDFAAQSSSPPTYTHDIAPILINRCIVCHSAGQIAPWSMDNYEKVRSHAAMIREVVRTKRMPPWGADPFYGNLKDDPTLTSQETQTIVHWVEQGMKRGDGPDPLLTAARPPTDGWPMGKPDFIVSFKKAQLIPATGLLDYRYIQGDKSIDQDRWIKAIYWKPGNRKVVHHARLVLKIVSPTKHQDWFINSGMYNFDMIPSYRDLRIISLYLPGGSPYIFPDDSGMFLPQGTQFLFNLHYTVTGKPEVDNTKAGLYFYKNKPVRILSTYRFSGRPNIPPHAKNFNLTGVLLIQNRITLYAINPHMHLRGRNMKIIAHYLDGSSQVILSVPHYRFYWQLMYYFQKPIALPVGTKIEIQASFDNSAQNPDNPDPDKTVKDGPFSSDEMMRALLFYVKGNSVFPERSNAGEVHEVTANADISNVTEEEEMGPARKEQQNH